MFPTFSDLFQMGSFEINAPVSYVLRIRIVKSDVLIFLFNTFALIYVGILSEPGTIVRRVIQ